MGVHSNWSRGRQQRRRIESDTHYDNQCSNSSRRNRSRRRNRALRQLLRLTRYDDSRRVYNNQSGSRISIYPELQWPRAIEPDHNKTCNPDRQRNQYNKYLLKLGKQLCLLSVLGATVTPAYAENVSATANPIANSSGSVTNQAIQVLQGPYITNTYGNQISCQGPTANFTPYIQYSNSWKDPFERTYMQPQYNNSDYTGRTTTTMTSVKNYPWYDGWLRGPNNADGTMGDFILDDDGEKIPIAENWYNDSVKTDASGNILVDEDGDPIRYIEDGADMAIEVEVDGPDGVPDNPGQVMWEKPVRTEMSANNNFNLGLSATFSLPLDKKLQRLCKQAAQTQINQQLQITANKRLDFEIARLKNCGELMKAGIMFHPRSPYASICADVVVTNPPGTLTPHSHEFPRPTFKEDNTENNSNGTKVEVNGSAKNLGTYSIGSPLSSSQPSSSSQTVDAASQNLSPVVPSSPDTHLSSPQPESSDKESSQASTGWFRWPFSRQASPPVEEDQPAALLGGPIQLPPSQSLP